MKKWRRRLLIAAGVVVGVIVLAAVLVPLLVPSEKWKNMAIERVRAETGLVVTAGEAGVSFPWPLGLQLDDITVSDPEGRTGLQSFRAEAQELVVTARIGPLLRGRIHVEQVILRQPLIELTQAEAVEPEAGSRDSLESPANGDVSAGATAVLGLFSVVDGRILVHDAAGGTLEVRGLQNRASLTTDQGDFDGEFSGELEELALPATDEAAPLVLTNLKWKGTFAARAQGREGRLELEELSLAGLRAQGQLDWDQSDQSLQSQWTVEGESAGVFREFVRPRLVLPEGWTAEDVDLAKGPIEGELRWNSSFGASVESMAAALAGEIRVGTAEIELLGDSGFGRARARVVIADGRVTADLDEIQAPGTTGSMKVQSDLLAREPVKVEGRLQVSAKEPVRWAERHWARLAPLAGPESPAPDEWPAVDGQAELEFEARIDPEAEPESTPDVDYVVRARRLALLPTTMTDSLVVRGGEIVGNMERVELRGLQLQGPGLEGQGTLVVENWIEAPAISGDVRLSQLDLDALQAAQRPMETAQGGLAPRWAWPWSVEVAHAAEATLPAPPADMKADVRVQADRMRSAGWEVQSVQGTVRLADQKLELPDAKGKMGTGNLDLQAAMDWTVDPPRWTTQTHARKIPASELLSPVAAPLAQALSAELSGDFELGGSYQTEIAQILMGLTGDVELSSEGGLLETTSLLGGRVAEFLGQRAGDWKQLRFRALDAGLRVADGAVHFDRFVLEGDTRVRAKGSVGLDGEANYSLAILLPPGSTPDLGSLGPVADLLRDESGRFAFGVNVSGPAAQPKVEIDFADLRERARKAGEDAARDGIKDALDDLGTKLKGQGEGEPDVKDAVGGLLDRLRKGDKKKEGGGGTDEKTGEGGGGG